LLCVLTVAARLPAQSPLPQSVGPAAANSAEGSAADTTAATAPGDTSQRIIDKPMRPGAGKAIVRIPLYPLIGLGKALEKGLLAVEEKSLIQKQSFAIQWLADRHMRTPSGGMGTGTGMAVGIAFFDDDAQGTRRVRWEIPLQISITNYQQFESHVQVALLPRYRLFLEGAARYRNRPREDFFGLGPASQVADRSNFLLQDRTIGGSLGTEFGKGRLAFDSWYVNAKTGDGRDHEYPDTDTLFPALAGLGRGSVLLKYGVSGALPWLDNVLDPRRGVRFRGRFYRVRSQRAADIFDHDEWGATGEFYIPLGGPRTLAIRGVGDFRTPHGGAQVPFYALPFLGGSRSMRGYREFRFYDNHALLFNLEYRYRIWKKADFALFLDQGQVAASLAAIDLAQFRASYGLGFRVKGMKGMGLRFDIGHSREGTRYYISFGPEWR
jgi:hypothetical protein